MAEKRYFLYDQDEDHQPADMTMTPYDVAAQWLDQNKIDGIPEVTVDEAWEDLDEGATLAAFYDEELMFELWVEIE